MVVKSIKERLVSRHHVAVAETGYLELWQRAELSVVSVSGTRRVLADQLDDPHVHAARVGQLHDLRRRARRCSATPASGEFRLSSVLAGETLTVLEHREFAPIFGAGSRAEVPVSACIDGRVIAGQIDRLIVTDEAVWIVDYKTGRQVPERAADTPPAYLRQMAAYRAVLERIYPGRAVRCALLWTDAPALMPLDDESLARWVP
mgnify:CR=1 FL=1